MMRAIQTLFGWLLVIVCLAQESVPSAPPASGSSATTFQYKFRSDQQERYQVIVETSGSLPLPGAMGASGALKLTLGVSMKVAKVEEQQATVQTALEEFNAEFNGSPFPVSLDMAKSVIPDSTATVTSRGKLSGLQGSGSIGMPLPGFDPRNLATLLFPIELPDTPLTSGATWQFVRTFGEGSNALRVPITARFEGVEEVEGVKLLKITQTFHLPIELFQDAFYQPVSDKEHATHVTRGEMKGNGVIYLHPDAGVLHKLSLSASLNQTREPIKRDGSEIKEFERETSQLSLTLNAARKSGASPPPTTESKAN
ncbi:MAG: hypothetical protein NZL85_01470 [Fimbriimonadales bacterium]|nr:hypothetical protein [Fimbriimonadales bacterium]